MPHISRHKLNPELSHKIFRKLIVTFEKADKNHGISAIINELFTDTEKVMFAKRVAIVLMLSNNTPQHRIVDILKVSPTTVAKISLHIEIGRYNMILKTSREEKMDMEKIVWNILTVGGIMPPKVGRSYWRKYSRK